MKKVWALAGILAAFGILIAMVAGFSGKAVAEDHQNHCICGGNSAAATAANGHTCAAVTWEPIATEAEFRAKMQSFDETTHTYLYLTADIEETAAFVPGKNQTLHLCLNGHTVTAGKNLRAFELCGPSGAGGYNAHMTVCDCSASGTGEIKAHPETETITYQGGTILITRELTFTLFGGTISGGRAKTGGGNIAVDPYNGGSDARFYMYGGTVKDGKIPSGGTNGGGNIIIGAGCKFYMYGGTVSGGRTEPNYGGGNVLLLDNAYFELAGGELKDGYVTYSGTGGGNVSVKTNADFRMSGGTLNHGISYNGGNLYINGSTKPVISGGVIKDGTAPGNTSAANGGNIDLVNTSGLTIRNATVSGGTLPTTGSNSYGGNIAVKNSSWLVLENVTVSGGTAVISGNLSLTQSATAEMTGGTITGGTSVKNGSSGGFGGNVSMSGTAKFTLNSGTISDGVANGATGGNIAMIGTNTLTINGGTITGGTNNSGGAGGISAYYQTTDAVVNLNGGTITGNDGGIHMTLGTLKVSGAPVVRNNGKDMTLSDPVNFVIAGPLTSGANLVVPYAIGTEFTESDEDYSSAFHSQYESLGAEVVYDAATHKYTVRADNYTDLNALTPTEAAAMKLDVYIISGQSNASGSTGLSTTAYENRDFNSYKNVHYWAKRINVDQTLSGCTITDYRPVAEGQGFDASHIGPELGMAQVLNPLYESSERQAIIFKYAAGGTSVVAHQNDDGTWVNNVSNTSKFGSWYPSCMETEASIAMGENRITNYLTRGWKSTITEFYQDLLSKGYLPENINFISMVWLQGESDRLIPDQYEPLFPLLMDEFRTHLATMTGRASDANLPIVVNEIASTFSGAVQSNVTNNLKFISMERRLANVIDNYITIPSSHVPLAKLVNGESVAVGNGDTWHYGYDDIVSIGRMLAEGSLDPDAPRHLHCDCGLGEDVGDHTTHVTKEWHPIGTPEELYGMNLTAAADSVEEYYLFLTSDIDMPTRIILGTNKHLHLCLNGHTIRQTSNTAPFALNSGAAKDRNESIVLTDCSATPGTMMGGQGSPNSFNGGVIYVGKYCSFTLYRGNLVGRTIAAGSSTATYNGYGGTVALGGGTPAASFTMYGGTISGGNASKGGGNVFVENGTFTMYGGTISGNPGAGNELTVDGANVYVYGGSFIMNGGIIENGNSTKNGGNLYIGGGSVTMHGGTIQGGYADAAGGNVFVGEGRTFTMDGGSILNGACNTSNGFNVQVNGTANFNGGTIQGANSRNNGARLAIAAGKASTRINIDGATINNTIQCVAGSSVTTLNSGTVYGFSAYNGNLVINGGQVNSAPTISGTSGTNTMTVNGGYIKGKPARTGSKPGLIVLKGGHYTVDPTEDYTAEGYYVFETNELYNGLNYQYEVGKGHLIETTSRAATGYLGTVAAISGGGRVMEGKPFTLTAPAVSGYRLVGWYEGSTELGVENTYTSTCTEDREIAAVYEVGAAEGFRVSVSGTTDYTITGEQVGTLYKAGTEVTVTYTGSGDFKGFTNAMGKLVSRDAAYTFALAGDTDLTAMIGSTDSTLITFYTINSQVYRSGSLSDFTALPAVPTVAGKKNGVWKAGGTEITDLAALASKAEGQTALDVTPAYEDDAASVYEVTVTGVLLGTSGTPDTWTAYAEGNGSYGPVNVNSTVKLGKPDAATKEFLFYMDANGTVLSTEAETYIRFKTNTTIYAVYDDVSIPGDEPTILFITAERIDGAVYFEALRNVPAGYTLKEQGILFNVDSMVNGTLEEALRYNNSAESYKYVSNGKEASDVTGLTLKNVSVPVNARAYLIYSDGTNEGIIYSAIETVN